MKSIRIFIVAVFVFSAAKAQVSLQTGSAQYSIPVFSYKDGKSGLGANISLEYSSGRGMQLDEIGSAVGVGWALNAGGFILRRQHGEPDDQSSLTRFPANTSYTCNTTDPHFNETVALLKWSNEARDYVNDYYGNGYLYTEFPISGPTDYERYPLETGIAPRFRPNAEKRYKQSRRSLADHEQDHFVFNFNGRSGQFLIGRDGSIKTVEDSKLKIVRTDQDLTDQGIKTTIQQFTITDENGVEYVFAGIEKSEGLAIKSFARGVAYGREYNHLMYERKGNPTFIIDKWFLTEIRNPLSGEKIFFEYENIITDVSATKDGSYERFQNTDFITWVINRSVSHTKRLVKMRCPDGHFVQFIYGYEPSAGYLERIDLPGDARLSEIRVGYNSGITYSFFLTHGYLFKKEIKSYTYNFAAEDKRYARLCLTGVKRDGQPKYEFDYHTGAESSDPNEIVPPYKCYAVDHWGYYNKATAAGPFNETPDLYALTYQAAANRVPADGFARLGLLKKITFPHGGSLTYEYEQNKYTKAGGQTISVGGVRVSKTTAFDDVTTANNAIIEYKYTKEDNTSSGWGYEEPAYHQHKEVLIENDPPFDSYPASGIMVADYKRALITSAVKIVVSIVLREILANVIVASVMAGQVYITIILIIVDIIIEYASWLLDQTDIYGLDSYDFNFLGSNNPIAFQYDRVEVRSISPGVQLGRTVTEFTSPRTLGESLPTALAAPYSNRIRYPYWKYGHTRRVLSYNESGSLVKETSNNFNVFAATFSNANFYSAKMVTRRTYSMRDPLALCYNGSNYDFDHDFYYPLTGRIELESTTETLYGVPGESGTITTKYEYNSLNYQVKTVYKTDSRGNQRGQSFFYPDDYTLPGVVQLMKTKNIINAPLVTAEWTRTCTGCNKKMLSAAVTEFAEINGSIKPVNNYVLESPSPLDNTFLVNFDPANLFNYSYLKPRNNYQYEWSSGNLLQMTAADGGKKSFIYDHNNRFVVAQVLNAAKEEIAYSSFEGNGKGNWVYNDAGISEDGLCPTGFKCFNLNSSNNISTAVAVNKPFVLTLWATSATAVIVNGSIAPARTGPSINGWTYLEYDLPQGTSSPVITGASVKVDEVRLYPVGAQMTSQTIVPLWGMTSECDVNNRIIYYEYDGFGRLFKVKDASRNLIKTYEYRYKNQ